MQYLGFFLPGRSKEKYRIWLLLIPDRHLVINNIDAPWLSGTILPVHHYPYLYSNDPHIYCDTAEKTVSAVFPEKRPDHSFLPYHSISGFYQDSRIFPFPYSSVQVQFSFTVPLHILHFFQKFAINMLHKPRFCRSLQCFFR